MTQKIRNHLCKSGNVYELTFDNHYTLTAQEDIHVMTLPSGFIPDHNIDATINGYGGITGWVRIDTEGKVYIDSFTTVTNYDLFCSISWINS